MPKPVHVEVIIRDQSQVERMIKRFSKKVKKLGLMEELRDRLYYTKKSVTKRLKKKRKKKMSQQQTEKSKINN